MIAKNGSKLIVNENGLKCLKMDKNAYCQKTTQNCKKMAKNCIIWKLFEKYQKLLNMMEK